LASPVRSTIPGTRENRVGAADQTVRRQKKSRSAPGFPFLALEAGLVTRALVWA